MKDEKMSTKETVVRFLEENSGHPVSGSAIAESLGISRTAVWKAIKSLEADGYMIDASTGKGYTLRQENDVISEAGIAKYLRKPEAANIIVHQSVTSTNDLLREAAMREDVPEGTIVVAAEQTKGKGRRGRSFFSPVGTGIYFSILLRPQCSPGELMHLTCATAVAMCDALEAAAGFRPGIKWTNDLVYGKKKLGGILTELGLTPQGMVDYAIIGIGINCRQQPDDFPVEIQNIAASLNMVTGKETGPALLAASMLDALWRIDGRLLTDKAGILDQYRQDCITLGQEISVVRGDAIRHGEAISVDGDGALVVAYSDGTQEAVNSGEVSIRGMYGYL